MSNPRSRRQRKRRDAQLSGAELEWLTGEVREDANKFERLTFKYPACPAHYDQLDDVLRRAVGVVDEVRIGELRKWVAGLRAEDRRKFPGRDEYLPK